MFCSSRFCVVTRRLLVLVRILAACVIGVIILLVLRVVEAGALPKG